jgi:hypothetical protein
MTKTPVPTPGYARDNDAQDSDGPPPDRDEGQTHRAAPEEGPTLVAGRSSRVRKPRKKTAT